MSDAAHERDGGVDGPRVARTRTELMELCGGSGDGGRSAGRGAVVMTMGALHDGHAALIRAARTLTGSADRGGRVIVTIFVNPLQFAAGEDFDRYPRTLDDDLAVCAAEGVDAVFAPAAGEMYPDGQPQVTVDPGLLGGELEGAVRPGHFAGVLTVVAKMLNLISPAYAVFGEKDYQQLVLIRRMVRDLDLPGQIVGVPTVRHPDGLALSSRNRYLTADQRKIATALSEAIAAGARAAGGRDAVLAAARSVLDRHPELDVDYLELRTGDLSAQARSGDARLLVAARLGATRLIDNTGLTLTP